MLPIRLAPQNGTGLQVLCLGAHSDDIEIGCAGTLSRLLREHAVSAVRWVVFSGGSSDVRRREATASAGTLLAGLNDQKIEVHSFRDGFFPYQGADIKECFERLKRGFNPDVVFTHHRGDLHQDHRLIAELTYNTFRDHVILEYEIPKYDGDLGNPNLLATLDAEGSREKVSHLMRHFESQRSRDWFTEDVFLGLMRLRGLAARSPSGFAEGFYCSRMVV